MYGDFVIREPARVESVAYAAAGAPVYVLYFDMDSVYDFFTGGEACCGVAHGQELIHTFNFYEPSDNPLAWEVDVTEYISNQISSIVKTGNA